jgi:hypothetical protein
MKPPVDGERIAQVQETSGRLLRHETLHRRTDGLLDGYGATT